MTVPVRSICLGASLAFAALFCKPGMTQSERVGTIKAADGDVSIRTAATGRPAAPGDPVTQAQTVVTGKAAGASLTMRDGTVLALGPSSALVLSEFSFNATTQQGSMAVRLLSGTLRMITGLLGKTSPDKVGITTSTSTIGIRGTDFIVETE